MITKRNLLWVSLLAAVLGFQTPARADLKLAAIFGDNMVLQQQMPVPIWGWSDPDAKVTVRFAGQTESTRADENGRWLVKLRKLKALANPQSLVVESGESKTFTNILVGEVWLASGQSNMEKPIGLKSGQKPCFNYQQELAEASHPGIRLFQVGRNLSTKPLKDLEKFEGWRECSSNALDSISFSAAAYFFGREIHTNLNVPVGLIESSWGGTRIEPWTPPAGFIQVSSLVQLATPQFGSGNVPNTTPTVLFNAMIAPVAGFAMRGALWYQGESNLIGGPDDYSYRDYADKMVALVAGWRRLWHEGDFPFYFVQIAPYKYYGGRTRRAPSPDSLPEFWALQSQAERRIKHSGMVVTTDLVDNLNDIHPRDKQDVGRRLALLALEQTYDREVQSSGPVFTRVKFTDGKAVLKFKNVGNGLMSMDGKPLTWFEVAGADGKFVPAEAEINGMATVEVSSSKVAKPEAVRFAWNETAQPNFCNRAGLPAEPFDTGETGKWK